MAIEIIEKITKELRNNTRPLTMYELIKKVNAQGRKYTHQQIKYVLGRMVREEKAQWNKEEDLIYLA